MELEGKVAIVTGSGKGIGKGIARCLGNEGAKVCINYNSNEELAQQTYEELTAEGIECFLHKADVSDRAQCFAMAEETVKRYGRIDILVNNAAIQKNYDLIEYDEVSLGQLVSINLKGYLYMMQACLEQLKLSKGSIVNISSVHAKRPTDFDVGYSFTKGGMHMLTREAAIEFARYGIRVNTLLPGGTKIEFKTGNPVWKRPANPIMRPKRYNPYPLGRAGLPSDSGYACAFLCSDKAEHISGTALRLDGCMTLL